ncbi:MFS transporter [Streptomyces viridiviolaceus]|uniref:MFS transporter n=1 Tax=Streptomyces viridiviolaceus TaxID=68282 RepID=A0ABW2DZ85_9ACTN|nr:MFS transporter [Streptomyces viridiviolaceus]
MVAAAGAGRVFAFNALSCPGIAAVLLLWRWPTMPRTITRGGQLMAAVWVGRRYLRHAPGVRRVLQRTALFIPGGAALRSLLPLGAGRSPDLGSGGHGLTLRPSVSVWRAAPSPCPLSGTGGLAGPVCRPPSTPPRSSGSRLGQRPGTRRLPRGIPGRAGTDNLCWPARPAGGRCTEPAPLPLNNAEGSFHRSAPGVRTQAGRRSGACVHHVPDRPEHRAAVTGPHETPARTARALNGSSRGPVIGPPPVRAAETCATHWGTYRRRLETTC